MRIVEYYRCEKCNRLYETMEEAQRCEEGHAARELLKVCGVTYMGGEVFPSEIMLRDLKTKEVQRYYKG